MRSRSLFFIGILIVLTLATSFLGGYLVRDYLDASGDHWPIFSQAYEILKNHGFKEIPLHKAIEYGMIRGMLQAYDDPYTSFVEPAQHELETGTLQGSFGGIGVRLGQDQDNRVVLFPFPDGPADQAGIQEGDLLLKVDDLVVDVGTAIDSVQAALRGPVGRKVVVTIARQPDFTPVELSIKREEIPLPSVTWHLDPDEPRLGVIEINVIAASTPAEVKNSIQDLQERGATAFVLDLRDNFGGLLTAGVDTARIFLADGVVIEQQYRDAQVETFQVERPGVYKDLPLTVLVNQNTASAAEIIAGALKVHGRAPLIGSPTFGKDSIQLVFDLKDGSSLHVTSAHWWVPGLEPPLGENGLQPDISIPVETQESAPNQAIQAATDLFFGND